MLSHDANAKNNASAATVISAEPFLTEEERNQVLFDWNVTQSEYPPVCVHELFEQQVANDPDAIALIYRDQEWTYGDLNRRANQVARHLRKLGVGPDVLVGVLLERSFNLVVALLGVWKAGGAYVPLDPSYPADRISFMLADAEVKVLLTEERCRPLASAMTGETVCLDSGWASIATEDGTDLDPAAAPANLAYVMYTSGSTGKPKGAMIQHDGLANYLCWAIKAYGIQPGDSSVVHTSISFDLTVTSLYTPLLAGAAVELLPEAMGAQNLIEALRQKKRSLVKITPAHLELLSQQLSPEEVDGMTKTFVIGGENLLAEGLQLWRNSAPGTRLINEYGPTETVVGCCVYEVRPEDPKSGSIPIGRPIANTQLYVLDNELQPVRPGVMGELYIGGAGVARGYFNRPELTKERFLADPFSSQPGARIYKTGDFARYRPDGVLEYLGRIDNQVKVRGYRIELGEIEAALANHPEVRSCVVLAREDVPGDKQLVAYVVPRDDRKPDFEQVRSFLTQRLPEYMAPAHYVVLDAFPLTQNGKIDRNALPAPDSRAVGSGSEAAPRDAVERQLAELWAKLLRVRHVGIHDDFFKLGGHSLLAVRMLVDLGKLGYQRLPLTVLVEAPTIAKLADVLRQQARGSSETSVELPQVQIDLANRYRPFSLNSIQQAYMIGRSDGVEMGNIPCQSYNEVDMEDWDRDRFENSLNKVIERHDMLRCVVLKNGDQQILPNPPRYKVEVDDLRALKPDAAMARLEATREKMVRCSPDPDQWPLFEFRASRLDERTTRLHIRIDLLIGDGRSYEILFNELMEFYRNPEASLPALELTFMDYLTALNSVENTGAFRDAREYWLQRAPSLPPAPDLPLAKNPAAISRPVFKRRTAKLDAEVWQKLKNQGGHHSATPSGILLAAYAEILAMWSKQQRFTVNLALFNRLPLHPQANDIIGDFTSVSLLEIDNSDAAPFARRVLRQQQQLWRDLDHRHFSGIQVMRELRRLQGVGPKAIMPVVFTSLLNLDDQGEGTTWSYRIGKPAFTITQTPQVYLDFIVQEDKGSLILNWDAVDELFADGMLDDMFDSFQRLLRELANTDATWDSSFADTSRRLLPSGQLEIRNQVNATEAPVSDELLHTPFLKQVAERPNQLAICTPKRRLTYAETYQRACRVERELLDRSVGPNQMVGVLMAKGWEQVVAVLGIHFAGAAYLPIDSELPVERQRYLMENSNVKVLLIQSELQSRLDVPQGIPVLAVDTMEPLESVPPAPRRRQQLDDLAYIIYTSGSTGLPKGVMIDHRGAMNTVLDINRRFDVGLRDRVLALSRLNFDLSVYDIFGLLAAGGAIVFPAPELAQDPSHWAELIVSEKVTLWNTVPALMQLMIEEASRKGGTGIGTTLRVVMMSGDWIPVNLPAQIQRVLPEAEIISMGGATEASIWSIMYPIEKVDPNWKSVPYGKPMVNQTFHVLNQALSPSPVWVPGQLYIGGIGVAKGYFGDEKKTNASFIQHPVTKERLYRTGDLGRYLPDGNIEF
ncbi:MAG TPA: amino acid adenylation domain-containing protein, partial [Bryobacteraceae bacterium]|nr:amino acid adenylation domain-containing protein [Bryobacteraceae bacterium]